MTTTTKNPNCASCEGFGDIRPATCTAAYLPEGQGKPSNARETLCDACASNSRIYCDIRPLGDEAPTLHFPEAMPSTTHYLPATPSYPTLNRPVTTRAQIAGRPTMPWKD